MLRKFWNSSKVVYVSVLPVTLPSTYGCINFCRNWEIKYDSPMHHILVLLQSKDFMVDPHNHTKHSSCRRSHYQTQLFIFKGRKISLSHVWSKGLWTDKLCFNYPFKRAQWKMITESFRLEGASGDHLVKPPAQARLPGGGHPGPCPESFWVSPRMETLQPLQATCFYVWQHPQ